MSKDILANAMSSIKNHEEVRKKEVLIDPASNLVGDVLEVMEKEDYIEGMEFIEDKKSGKYKVSLKGNINNCGVIKPRFSIEAGDFEKWEKRYLPAAGYGLLAESTPRGEKSHKEAKEKGLGGRLIAFVY